MTAKTIESLTLSDFEAAGWREIIEAASGKTCFNYAELFQPKFVEAEKIENAVCARVYRLLMEVSYLRAMLMLLCSTIWRSQWRTRR